MHDMRTIAVDDRDVCQSVRPSVCPSVTWASCANTTERIDVLFGVKISESRRNILLDGCPHPPLPARGRAAEFDAAIAKSLLPPVGYNMHCYSAVTFIQS